MLCSRLCLSADGTDCIFHLSLFKSLTSLLQGSREGKTQIFDGKPFILGLKITLDPDNIILQLQRIATLHKTIVLKYMKLTNFENFLNEMEEKSLHLKGNSGISEFLLSLSLS